jgi:hypothetical protein
MIPGGSGQVTINPDALSGELWLGDKKNELPSTMF